MKVVVRSCPMTSHGKLHTFV